METSNSEAGQCNPAVHPGERGEPAVMSGSAVSAKISTIHLNSLKKFDPFSWEGDIINF